MAETMNDKQVADALRGLDGWGGDSSGLRRTVELSDFHEAIRVVDRIAEEAEQMNHHPDIDIRWRKLILACATHSAGGVTDADVDMARRINAILAQATLA
jgi:4a-hydroxytetrahydrobiopterin dehydratase